MPGKVLQDTDVKANVEKPPLDEPVKEESEVTEEKETKSAKKKRSLVGQPTIMSMFSKVKRKSTADEKENENKPGNEEKKIKLDDDVKAETKDEVDSKDTKDETKTETSASDLSSEKSEEKEPEAKTAPAESTITKSPPVKCSECKQLLADSDLKMFIGDPEDSVDEFVMLTDPKLSLFSGDEMEINEMDERPQHKVTDFTVYDKHGHLCPFDSGLIEKNKELYFSGYVKPVYDENPSTDGGIPTRKMGPINEWWTAGFDGGEKPLIGFSTGFCDYYLMNPSEHFEPIMATMTEKIYMSKVVIEFMANNQDATYEDLVNQIQTTVPPQGSAGFTEDTLLRHAQWVVEQVCKVFQVLLILKTSCSKWSPLKSHPIVNVFSLL